MKKIAKVIQKNSYLNFCVYMDKKYLLTDFIIQIAAHCKIKYKSNNGLFEIQAALTKIVLT